MSAGLLHWIIAAIHGRAKTIALAALESRSGRERAKLTTTDNATIIRERQRRTAMGIRS
jgi:hypothetical protein